MSDSNGTTSTATVPPTAPPQQEVSKPYRPEADRAKVYATIERSLNDIVFEAAHQAAMFVSDSRDYHGDTLVVRYAHLVDAAECLEIALTHLGLLKAAMVFRLHTEDDENMGPCPF